MDQLVPAIVGVLSTLAGVVGAALVARRYQRLGGGAAQLQLNTTLKQTMDAQGAEISTLRRQLDDAQKTILELAADFKACKALLIKLERTVGEGRTES